MSTFYFIFLLFSFFFSFLILKSLILTCVPKHEDVYILILKDQNTLESLERETLSKKIIEEIM